jgi:hypothetical protein
MPTLVPLVGWDGSSKLMKAFHLSENVYPNVKLHTTVTKKLLSVPYVIFKIVYTVLTQIPVTIVLLHTSYG